MHLALSRIVSQHETLAAQPPENSTLSVWLQGFIAESRIGVLTSAKLVSWPASFPAAVHNYRPDNHANGVSRTPKPPVCFPALPLWPGGAKLCYSLSEYMSPHEIFLKVATAKLTLENIGDLIPILAMNTSS